MDWDMAFAILMSREGEYSNDPVDPGGETMHGITLAVARANGYEGPMQKLPLDTAKSIAWNEYWIPAHCPELPGALQFDVFDMAYNSGVSTAIFHLQIAAGVEPDGIFGPLTNAAVGAANLAQLRLRFNAVRLRFYTSLDTFGTFGRGWINRIAENMEIS